MADGASSLFTHFPRPLILGLLHSLLFIPTDYGCIMSHPSINTTLFIDHPGWPLSRDEWVVFPRTAILLLSLMLRSESLWGCTFLPFCCGAFGSSREALVNWDNV
ncbi:hypothetical protein BDN70DRAFT_287756 [Pholiota conissans]|uniref:Uncharacterized protein n=1 Tax=Pholiota conissans TaxID=109636 RepID=A0A9P5YTM0_9AGAR|nr:hypothetical protein BDN70DRAFT_287756 [Pholiota conissans]